VTAGVIGIRKFTYDIWGDTVNVASRLESHGLPGEVHVSTPVFERLKGRFSFEERGEVELKGVGTARTYLLRAPAG
jgi:adenylate cyclase